MSHSHIRVPKLPPRRRPWLEFVIGGVLIVFLALVALGKSLDWTSRRNYATATGTIIETRIVIDHYLDSQYGGQIFYRKETHVTYELQGREQNRWLTASDTTTPRELLASKLASHPSSCLVYWVANHPENAKCQLK